MNLDEELDIHIPTVALKSYTDDVTKQVFYQVIYLENKLIKQEELSMFINYPDKFIIGLDKNKKLKLRINNIDPETLKIDFYVADGNSWASKKGRSTIDEIINLLYNESLFGSEEFREHYLKFLQKTIL